MPSIPFGLSAFERAAGDLPDLPVVNMFAEQAPTEKRGVVLQSCFGLVDRAQSMGSGPIEALFQLDNVATGALLGVSNGTAYSGSNTLGEVAGPLVPSIAGGDIGAMFAAGEGLTSYDGASYSAVPFPDDADVAKVVYGASRFIAIRRGTGRFHWSPPLSATFDGLDFATAETSPDGLVDALFIDDTLVLFGTRTVEFWPNTSDADLPFRPLEGRVFERGCRATGCAAIWNATFAWVGDDNAVYVNGQSPVPISNAGLEEKIAASSDVRLFTHRMEAQEFLTLRLDDETWIFGSRNGMWSKRSSGGGNWQVRCATDNILGCDDGKTALFGKAYNEFGKIMERRLRAGFPLDGGRQNVTNVNLRCNPGQTPFLDGQYADPTVEMRLSRNSGQTWSDWRRRSLGEQGRYRDRVQWRACGQASQPGMMFEFRLTDPVPLRVSDVLVNEAWGGR